MVLNGFEPFEASISTIWASKGAPGWACVEPFMEAFGSLLSEAQLYVDARAEADAHGVGQ